jgi:conjugative relaxase-like TrwC/TraI family protein
VLTVKKVLAGRGAVDYYLAQTRHGLTDYYLGDGVTPAAPAPVWWGGGVDALGLSEGVTRDQFQPLYAEGKKPGGDVLGRRFRLPDDAAAARQVSLTQADGIEDAYERWMARHRVNTRAPRPSVAAWDCTFSPVKSVSLLWAAGDDSVRSEVWAAHLVAVDAGLAYLQEHASYVRAGRNGVRILETMGLVVARFNEWTSRDGDMHIHTHCVVLNRAQTREDEKWRALDGRSLLEARTGAGAIYNRILEAQLTQRLGVAWRDRDDGLRELAGVSDKLIEVFSSRRRAITSRTTELAAAYETKYGMPPPPQLLSQMGEQAFYQTRRRKKDPSPHQALEAWEKKMREHGSRIQGLAQTVTGRRRVNGSSQGAQSQDRDRQARKVLSLLAETDRPTVNRHDILRACLDVVSADTIDPEKMEAEASRLAQQIKSSPNLLAVTSPDPIATPSELQRSDGSSIYERPERERWALRSTLDAEAWLLHVADETTQPTVPTELTSRVSVFHSLGDDQAQAVSDLLGSDRRIRVLIGPAGAGKTRALRAVVDAWERSGGEVVGLTVSQSAARVLAEEAQVRAENTAKWLHETTAGNWKLPKGGLFLIDEASMVPTSDLVTLAEQARHAGGRVVLSGDPAQLGSIGVGGGFELLAHRIGASVLDEIRRFDNNWERKASKALRQRNPDSLAEYAMRARIHGGVSGEIEEELFAAWETDALTTDDDRTRRSVLMVVSTNEQAADLAARARTSLIDRGVVDEELAVTLRDNPASIGDHIVTRRNHRKLVTSNDGWVTNGDVWTITDIRPGGVLAKSHADDSTVVLPGWYLERFCHLAYAITAHRAQGMTVDVSHALITTDLPHNLFYVAATRGRQANHFWVSLDSAQDLVAASTHLPTPEQVLFETLRRRDPQTLSAHQVIAESQNEMSSLARVGAIYEDTARQITGDWLAQQLKRHGIEGVTAEPSWPALVAKVRELSLAGFDVEGLLRSASTSRSVDDVDSVPAVILTRLGRLTQSRPPNRKRGSLSSLPPVEGPTADVAGHTGELIRQRWRELRQTLATEPTPQWAEELGDRPDTHPDTTEWLGAATPAAGYRERYEVPDYTKMLGPRPTRTRPDARAAWEYARERVDQYLAHDLKELTDVEIADLEASLRQTLSTYPSFDPEELEAAHQTSTEEGTSIDGHETQAEAHRGWRRRSAQAQSRLRQIAITRATRRVSRITRSHEPLQW